jgi:predicted DNA-binding transcriptional regulator AlpA
VLEDDLADLVTGAEIGRRLGVSTQRVHQLASQQSFPRPLGRVGNSIVWRWDDLERWNLRRRLDPEVAAADIATLGLPARTCNVLRRVGVATIGDLVTRSREELQAVPNFSRRSITELEAALGRKRLGLRAPHPRPSSHIAKVRPGGQAGAFG